MDVRTRNVAAGARYRDWIDVDGVQLGLVQQREHRGTDRARAAAHVDHHGPRPGESCGFADQELRAPAGHEDPRVHRDPQAAELRPTQDLFQRESRRPLLHHRGQISRRARRGDQQRCFVLGENAAGFP